MAHLPGGSWLHEPLRRAGPLRGGRPSAQPPPWPSSCWHTMPALGGVQWLLCPLHPQHSAQPLFNLGPEGPASRQPQQAAAPPGTPTRTHPAG